MNLGKGPRGQLEVHQPLSVCHSTFNLRLGGKTGQKRDWPDALEIAF